MTFIPCDDEYDAKHKNILRCIEKAVSVSDIADDFLLSSDDHFYVRETDFDKYPIFRKGMLPSFVAPDDAHYEYTQSLVSTSMVLKAAGTATRISTKRCSANRNLKRCAICRLPCRAVANRRV